MNRLVPFVLAVTFLLFAAGCGGDKKTYRSLSSEGAIKRINKDNAKK
jgi:hypothetical protein